MFSPYSPASASELGTLSPVVFTGLAEAGDAGVSLTFAAALLELPAFCETVVHAFIQMTKLAITAMAPRAAVFHQLCGSLPLNIEFIVLVLVLQPPSAPDALLPGQST